MFINREFKSLPGSAGEEQEPALVGVHSAPRLKVHSVFALHLCRFVSANT